MKTIFLFAILALSFCSAFTQVKHSEVSRVKHENMPVINHVSGLSVSDSVKKIIVSHIPSKSCNLQVNRALYVNRELYGYIDTCTRHYTIKVSYSGDTVNEIAITGNWEKNYFFLRWKNDSISNIIFSDDLQMFDERFLPDVYAAFKDSFFELFHIEVPEDIGKEMYGQKTIFFSQAIDQEMWQILAEDLRFSFSLKPKGKLKTSLK